MPVKARRPWAARKGRPSSSPGGTERVPKGGELRFSGDRVAVLGRCGGGFAPKREAWRRLARHYLAALGYPRASLCLKLVGDAESLALNARLRGVDAPTDILSFPALSKRPPRDFGGHLGDLALDLGYAWRKRGRFHPRFEGEGAFLLLHGLLHLAGHHHDDAAAERRLWRLQRRHFPPPPGLLRGLKGLRSRKK